MSLFSLRKKIQEQIYLCEIQLKKPTMSGNWYSYHNIYSNILTELDIEISSIESRVSQLKKIRRNRLDIEKSLDIQCKLETLRVVLGK